jgi:hypothetical protein
MGVCSYGGGTIPAHSKQFCEDNKGVWSEGTAEEKGFQGNILIGKDFGNAVMNSMNMEGADGKEKFGEYVNRRVEDDPAGLAMDALLYGVGGGYGVLGKLGLRGIMKAAFTKKKNLPDKWTLKNQPPPGFQGALPKSAYDIKSGLTKTVLRPYATGGAALGLGIADQAGFTTPWNEPFSARGKENRLAMQQKALDNSKAGIDADNKKKEEEETKKEAAIEAQNKIDNMSFFDKFKLGMKDPAIAAQFGAGLQDIGSNIPGQNTLGELQGDYATAAASGGPSAADFNAQKVDKETLMNLFRSKKPFLIGDSEEERDKKASTKVAKYYAVRAKMFTEGYPTDHDSIMAMLEKLYG